MDILPNVYHIASYSYRAVAAFFHLFFVVYGRDLKRQARLRLCNDAGFVLDMQLVHFTNRMLFMN